jgi:carbon starvation protein
MALSLATTVLIKMRRGSLVWVTLIPLGWLVVVTFSAGWIKIFSPDARLGFLTAMREFSAAGKTDLAAIQAMNAGITAFFLILVILILAACGRIWLRKWRGKSVPPLTEESWA